MKSFFRDNGLTIALMTLFMLSFIGMLGSGYFVYDKQLHSHGLPSIRFFAYMKSGEFLSALFENWESEFLQMSAYVVLTASLFQRGSSESRSPDAPDRADDQLPPDTSRRNPYWSWIYSHSLGIALTLLFITSFTLHWWASMVAANDEALRNGEQLESFIAYLFSAQLWFESFQNWQSEFMSTAALVVLSIILRHRGSPESKPVNAANSQTGSS
ncbi:hypothetical protein FPY71_08435 [Aureimonas fodinaquatilis]|uniref:Transmembrane protein n=1 Tax=Aureimonas fodinaquatilis TaxID=2565783 RepID=A0A5B0DVS2_9HYPH|nr:DUF6766 family protein [Aureimonas fodinaquatilis]KAA0970523.1 hypothetical protein FPY71_08435 [Aureimonas fodinaquatilis]